MNSGEVLLAAERIHHRYRGGDAEFVALRDINLEVRSGEILFLVGPSGSGKTTLIQVMGCLLRPTEGRVSFRGESVSDSSEDRRNALRRQYFGFVFQTNNLFPTLTSTENVMVALDLLGFEARDAWKKARDLLTSVGLSDKLDALPGQLSGGQRQRVGIARALACNPLIVLADEPTAALDAESGHRVMELMRRMAHDDNRAVVIVTHDNRITDLADRIIRLDDGRIVGELLDNERGYR